VRIAEPRRREQIWEGGQNPAAGPRREFKPLLEEEKKRKWLRKTGGGEEERQLSLGNEKTGFAQEEEGESQVHNRGGKAF